MSPRRGGHGRGRADRARALGRDRERPTVPRRAGVVVEIHGIRATVLFANDARPDRPGGAEDPRPASARRRWPLPSPGARIRCRPLRSRDNLAIGDRVTVAFGPHGPEVEALSERERSLWRPAEHGRRVMATHVDRLVVVGAVRPEFKPGLVDRFLVAADAEDIPAVLVLNKVDLAAEEPDLLTAAREALRPYAALDYPVLEVAAATGQGLEALEALVSDGLSVFVGHSGVGKSSLLNRLVPHAGLGVGEVSDVTGKGRHTTTVTTCHAIGPEPYPAGGMLVDTPGVRAFGLYGIAPERLAWGFRDLREPASRCRFRNCLHRDEPGCAVRAAVASEDVDSDRFARYLRLVASLLAGEG